MTGGRPGELISRETLERVIKRAAELQATERDVGDELTEPELLDLGKEVGIPSRYLQQALLEERTKVEVAPANGLSGWLLGPTHLHAERVVPGDKSQVMDAMSRWMQDEELLQVKRRFPDRTSWEPQRGFFASFRRGIGVGGKSYALGRAREVIADVTQLEPGFCHVRLMADVTGTRNERKWWAISLFGLGAVLTGAAVPIGFLLPWAYLPLAVSTPIALITARTYRGEHEKIQVSLEQVLDRLERGEIRPEHQLPASPRGSAFVRIADEIRKAFQ
jgi:hypothetical protein